jgi:hypothetical protein
MRSRLTTGACPCRPCAVDLRPAGPAQHQVRRADVAVVAPAAELGGDPRAAGGIPPPAKTRPASSARWLADPADQHAAGWPVRQLPQNHRVNRSVMRSSQHDRDAVGGWGHLVQAHQARGPGARPGRPGAAQVQPPGRQGTADGGCLRMVTPGQQRPPGWRQTKTTCAAVPFLLAASAGSTQMASSARPCGNSASRSCAAGSCGPPSGWAHWRILKGGRDGGQKLGVSP